MIAATMNITTTFPAALITTHAASSAIGSSTSWIQRGTTVSIGAAAAAFAPGCAPEEPPSSCGSAGALAAGSGVAHSACTATACTMAAV